MNENEILVLRDEDGNESELEILAHVEYLDDQYVVLLPMDEDYDGPVVIMKEEHSEYFFIDEEYIIEEVFKLFTEMSDQE